MKATKQDDEKSVVMGTKVAPWAAEAWNAICDALETDTYNLLQQFIYAMIRGASQGHEMTPEIRRLLTLLDIDVAWQKAINLCAPSGKLSIAQMILIVEQEGKTGFGAVMLDKPFMGDVQQTENVDQIFERVVEIIFKKTYLKLRQLGNMMHVKSQRQLLETILDKAMEDEAERDLQESLPGFDDRAENGRQVAYGKRTKAKQYRTPDSIANDQRFKFDDDDWTDTPEYAEPLATEVPNFDTPYAEGDNECDDAWTAIENGQEIDDDYEQE